VTGTSAAVVPSLTDANAASEESFVAAIGPLFEGAPAFLRRLAGERPFASWDALFDAARDVARAMPERDQIELLDAHPRIGAARAALSAFSRDEQAPEPTDLDTRLRDLNDRYEARFGFRFVVFVAGRPRAAIVPLIEAALDAERDAELRRGLDDVVAIAADRFAKLVRASASAQARGRT
jgi:2-oxo-4-hydroxy-4-carboxy--5-ureidoimidazoline (OHCU) decarboxylase